MQTLIDLISSTNKLVGSLNSTDKILKPVSGLLSDAPIVKEEKLAKAEKMFCVECKHKANTANTQREASNVESLLVSVLHLNRDGLVSRGNGPKTASMMSELLNKTSGWQTPQIWSRALFLKLDKA